MSAVGPPYMGRLLILQLSAGVLSSSALAPPAYASLF